MEQLPKIVRERLRAGEKPEVHPDLDLLTAFAESSLPERERASVLQHLSACPACREVISLAQPELVMEHVAAMAATAAASPASAPSASKKSFWSNRLILGWAALAACIVLGIGLLQYQAREKPLAQLAARQVSAQPIVPPPSPAADAMAQPAAPPPENQLEARLHPPPQSKFEAPADKNSVPQLPRRAASQLTAPHPAEKKFGAVAEVTGGAVSLGAGASSPAVQIPPSSQQVAVNAENGALTAAANPRADIPSQTRSPGVAAKDVAAAPSSPPFTKESQKTETTASSGPGTGGGTGSGAAFSGRIANAEIAQEKMSHQVLARASSNYLPAHWTISSDGSSLLRSIGEGGSWTVVNVANNVAFRAVAALGPEVWAGGKAGALYRSTDLGLHWTQLQPSAGGIALTADIVSIECADPQHAKLTTSEGKVWMTTDAGKTWQTQ